MLKIHIDWMIIMKIKIITMLFLCFLTSGCWNYNELNDFAIATGMGIDKHENGYKVSLVISNSQSTQGSSREGEAQTTVFTGTGKSITEALNKIDTKTPRNLYLGHLAVVVIDEEVARDDIDVVLESLVRNPETAKKYQITLARNNKAEEILKTLSPLESFPSQNISNNIITSANTQSITTESFISDFIMTLLKPGVNGVISSISIQGDGEKIDNQDDLKNTEPKAMLETKTIGLFKEFKLVTWTTEKESLGINIINNDTDRLYISNELEDAHVVVLVDDTKCKPKITIKDEIEVSLDIKTDGAITEVDGDIDLENPESIEKINKLTETSIKEMIYDGIKVAKEYKTDIFGFGNMIYQQNYKYWYKVKDNWHDLYFPEINVKVKVDVNLKSKGSLENTIKEKKNER